MVGDCDARKWISCDMAWFMKIKVTCERNFKFTLNYERATINHVETADIAFCKQKVDLKKFIDAVKYDRLHGHCQL